MFALSAGTGRASVSKAGRTNNMADKLGFVPITCELDTTSLSHQHDNTHTMFPRASLNGRTLDIRSREIAFSVNTPENLRDTGHKKVQTSLNGFDGIGGISLYNLLSELGHTPENEELICNAVTSMITILGVAAIDVAMDRTQGAQAVTVQEGGISSIYTTRQIYTGQLMQAYAATPEELKAISGAHARGLGYIDGKVTLLVRPLEAGDIAERTLIDMAAYIHATDSFLQAYSFLSDENNARIWSLEEMVNWSLFCGVKFMIHWNMFKRENRSVARELKERNGHRADDNQWVTTLAAFTNLIKPSSSEIVIESERADALEFEGHVDSLFKNGEIKQLAMDFRQQFLKDIFKHPMKIRAEDRFGYNKRTKRNDAFKHNRTQKSCSPDLTTQMGRFLRAECELFKTAIKAQSTRVLIEAQTVLGPCTSGCSPDNMAEVNISRVQLRA